MQTDENDKFQTDAINDANWRKYKNEIGAAFATDSLPHKTQNQKPNPKRSYWHTTEKLYPLETEGETASSLETAYSG